MATCSTIGDPNAGDFKDNEFSPQGGAGKTWDALSYSDIVARAKKVLDKNYPGLFEDAEKAADKTLDQGWLRINRRNAQEAAINKVLREVEADGQIIGRIVYEGKWKASDKLAIAVSEQYREFLENPGKLNSYVNAIKVG